MLSEVLSPIGLGIDLVGVMMLGFDLVRVQHKLRMDAQGRLDALAEVVGNAGRIDAYLKNISGDWREYIRDEGRYVPMGSEFDYRSAMVAIDEIKDGISGISDDVRSLGEMMTIAVNSDRKAAATSLWVSYSGLLLIALGFAMQLSPYVLR